MTYEPKHNDKVTVTADGNDAIVWSRTAVEVAS